MIDWLVSTFVATSALMAAVLVIREPVRRTFGAPVAYALWLLPAARAVLPSFTQTVERVVPAAAPPAQVATYSVPTSAAAATAPALSVDWPLLLLAVWLAGAVVMTIRGLVTYHRQRSGIVGDAVQMARLGGIRILRSERVRGPVAFGIVDRVIVLPLDFDDKFTDRQRCLALEHELSHHRSGDLVANLFAFVLLCLQWFNPLAWAAHAAFRFDQEAACDARVLDKAQPGERASYGAAIAKAASGRTFLFSGALDRPSTLSRRLIIMTNIENAQRRRAGFAIVGGALLLALPLTASKAIDYVDIAAPAPVAEVKAVPAVAATASLTPTAAVAPVASVAAIAPVAATLSLTEPNINFLANDTVQINGVTKRWDQLTPAERAHIRAETAKARVDVQRTLDQLPAELANAERETQKFRNGEFRREIEQARVQVREALAEVDRNAAVMRAAGEDVDKVKADIRRSLAEVENMDIDKVIRQSLASIDTRKIEAEVRGSMKSLDDIDAKLDALDRR
jgi:beta-lactamase regulating signal transducer with metallopeptidase domain